MKEKIGKMDFNKIKNLSSFKDTVKRMERQKPQTGRKYLQNISDKGLLSKVCRELLKFSSYKVGKRSEQTLYLRMYANGK